jgi:hypothetical protein
MSLSRKYVETLINKEISHNENYKDYPPEKLISLANQVYLAQITHNDKSEQKKTIIDKIEHFQLLMQDSGSE